MGILERARHSVVCPRIKIIKEGKISRMTSSHRYCDYELTDKGKTALVSGEAQAFHWGMPPFLKLVKKGISRAIRGDTIDPIMAFRAEYAGYTRKKV